MARLAGTHPPVKTRQSLLIVVWLSVILGSALIVFWLDSRYSTVPAASIPPAPRSTATVDPGTRWYFNRSQWFPEEIPSP